MSSGGRRLEQHIDLADMNTLVDPVRPRLARDVLHHGHGARPNRHDRHSMAAHAMARDAAGCVGGVEEGYGLD